MKLSIATAIAALSLAGTAFADGRVTATLDQGANAPGKFIAAHAAWTCTGGACATGVANDDAGSLDGCKDFVKHAGRVTSYGEFKPLDAKSLAKCNLAAGPASTGTATASR